MAFFTCFTHEKRPQNNFFQVDVEKRRNFFLYHSQECNEIPYEDCKTIHKLVPHQVSRKKTVKICDGVQADTDSKLTFPTYDDIARENQPESVPALVYSG